MIQYGLHSAPDLMASEYEVSEFLGALVRLLKPKVIIETGCYQGHSTRKMAEAVKENGVGHFWTCDTDTEKCKETGDAVSELPVGIEICSGLELIERISGVRSIDLAFIDSSGDRVAEVQALQLSPGAVVVLHDSKRPQYKPIWTAHPWRVIWEIPTEQGLTLFVL